MFTQEDLDRVDDKLGKFCAAGYALGLIGEANIRFMLERFPGLVMRQRAYRLGDIATLRHGVAAEYSDEQVAEIAMIEAELDGLEDYPVIDDGTFEQVFDEERDVVVAHLAEEHGVTIDQVWNAIYDANAEFEWAQDYAYLVDEQAVLDRLGVGG